MKETETITTATSSHLYTRKGWEIENISGRLVGIVMVNHRKSWRWSGWKEKWIELHDDYLLFYKYNKRRRHYSKIMIDFKKPDTKYSIGGLECDGQMFSFSVFKNSKKKFTIKTPHVSGVKILYPNLENILNVNGAR